MSDKLLHDTEIDSLLPSEVSALMSEELEDLCRLCMSSEKNNAGLDMVAISDKYPNSNRLISSLFFDVLQINTDDAASSSMPQKACMECLRKLYLYADFREQSLCVDAKLRQIVYKKQKLSEAQALYGPVFADLDAPLSSSLEATDERRHDICTPTVPTEENVGELAEEKSCLNVLKVEGLWDDSVTEDSESNLNNTRIFNLTKSVSNSILKCSENESRANAANFSREVCSASETLSDSVSTSHRKGHKARKTNTCVVSSLSATLTAAVNIPTVTCFNNQSETAVKDNPVCPDIVGEIVVPDSSAAEEDSTAVDFVPDRVDVSEVLSPRVGANTSDTVSLDRSIMKCSSSRLPVPEVFAMVGEQAEKQLGFRCPLCKKAFQSLIQFRKHASFHVKAKGGVCKYCDKWFQTSNALFRHERIHSGEKPFLCILCDRSFSQREILQRHILTHTDTKPFQCQLCDKSYAQKNGLDTHVKNHHKPTLEISQYPCLLCNKAFCHPSGLSRHMLTHSGKQYVCKFCERNFSDSSALRRHTRNKHGSLP